MLELAVGAILTQTIAKPLPYQVIQNTKDAVCIKLDPKRSSPHVVTNAPTAKGLPFTLSFTGNYFWRGTPIGILMDRGRVFYAYKDYYYDRPCLFLGKKVRIGLPELSGTPDEIVVQAGPTLVKGGKVSIQRSEEKFRSDVIRITQQLSVGVTGANKLIVLYTENWSVTKIATHLVKLGCTDALKMDGGSSAYIAFKAPGHQIYRGRTNQIVCGIGLNLW